ncbi:unnamed protein product [Gongylonema pulchrum]|uniref:CTNNB1_binding domain-containing protein n=1 Tax=Gongylonema pulchrum TaxID=637853 RepID=A0A183EGA7_9BILA|nr:unnamed protein product [Gongylonema pulchrum]
MEQDEMDADSDDALNHDSFSEEEHEKLNKNEEYPGTVNFWT